MRLSRWIEHLVATVLVVMLAGGMTNIVLRLADGGGLIWYNDLSRYLLVWLTFLGAAAVSFRQAHITISDEISAGLSPGLRRAAMLMRHGIVLIFLGIVFYEGVRLTQQVAVQGFVTVRWLSLGFGYAALPIAAALMIAATLIAAMGKATRKAKP